MQQAREGLLRFRRETARKSRLANLSTTVSSWYLLTRLIWTVLSAVAVRSLRRSLHSYREWTRAKLLWLAKVNGDVIYANLAWSAWLMLRLPKTKSIKRWSRQRQVKSGAICNASNLDLLEVVIKQSVSNKSVTQSWEKTLTIRYQSQRISYAAHSSVYKIWKAQSARERTSLVKFWVTKRSFIPKLFQAQLITHRRTICARALSLCMTWWIRIKSQTKA